MFFTGRRRRTRSGSLHSTSCRAAFGRLLIFRFGQRRPGVSSCQVVVPLAGVLFPLFAGSRWGGRGCGGKGVAASVRLTLPSRSFRIPSKVGPNKKVLKHGAWTNPPSARGGSLRRGPSPRKSPLSRGPRFRGISPTLGRTLHVDRGYRDNVDGCEFLLGTT